MGNSVSANDPVQYVNFMTDGVCAETPAANGTYWRSWQADLKADCCPGGMFVGDIPRNPGLAIVWILILCWIFMGVALGAEVFMTAIEVVTAKELSKRTPDGKVYHVAVWNATVANLTLMALGSSAPEILLSIIEVLNLNFNAGDLGPSTIVGSAAFNLMVITAVCIVCLPEGEKRTLNQFGVFLTTASYSIIAYIWLYIIVLAWTPEVVTVAEGAITCVLMIILIGQAYAADKYQEKQTQAKKYKGVGGVKGVSKGEAAAAIKAANLPKDATPMQIHQALEEELMPPKSKLHYRKQAIGLAKNPPGNATKVMPEIEDMDGGRAKRVDANMADSPPPTNDPDAAGMIMWAKPTYEVMESGGSVTVEVVRVGGTKGEVSCSYTTKNQKAVAGKDFKACDGTLTWADGATDKKEIPIEIYDDDEF
jgi:solute carrier family 8 (sodium/calcium exchanger)